MKKGKPLLKTILISIVIFSTLSFEVPEGWTKGKGKGTEEYEAGIDKGAGQNGGNALTIKSINKKVKGMESLFQKALPGKFLGKRIKMSGFVKSENANAGGCLFIRTISNSKVISEDNMSHRLVKGTSSWKKYDLVLDVPVNTTVMSYGGILHNSGQIWFDDISFEIVPDSIKVTNGGDENNILPEPTNTNFDK
ncbi:MAG: hypothetical protein ABI723_05510 [Bacteroidia bacterium]